MTGATWGDLGLDLLKLAREDLLTFAVVCVCAALVLGASLAIMVLILKVVVIGPMARHTLGYDEARQQARERREPRLPL